MLVILNVSKNIFNNVVASFTEAHASDYYNVGGGAYTTVTFKDGDVWGGELPAPVKAVYHFGGRHDYAIRPGYRLNEDAAVYRTSAGNMYGTYRENDEYYIFHYGSRSTLGNFLSAYADGNHKVVSYISGGPLDMLWHEEEFSYTLRKGYSYALERNCVTWLIDDYEQCSQTANDLYVHYVREGKDVLLDAAAQYLKGKDAEKIVLDYYRNKKVVVNTNTPVIVQVAWKSLSDEVRSRISAW